MLNIDQLIDELLQLRAKGCTGIVFVTTPHGRDYVVDSVGSDGYRNGTPGSDGPEIRLAHT